METSKPVFQSSLADIALAKPSLMSKITPNTKFYSSRMNSIEFEIDTVDGDDVMVYMRRIYEANGSWEKWSMKDIVWAFEKGEYSFKPFKS